VITVILCNVFTLDVPLPSPVIKLGVRIPTKKERKGTDWFWLTVTGVYHPRRAVPNQIPNRNRKKFFASHTQCATICGMCDGHKMSQFRTCNLGHTLWFFFKLCSVICWVFATQQRKKDRSLIIITIPTPQSTPNIQIHALQNNIHVSKVHCGSAFEPGASGLLHYCTPPVIAPDVIGACS